MGLFYPKLGIAWRSKFPSISGNIGFLAQSGGMCNIAIYTGKEMGLGFSKVFSFGNGADLDFIDLLYFLNNDPETDIILSYVEGIKKNRANDLKKVLGQFKKPLVVLKGGKTKRGSIAAKTHTASISGNDRIWDALFKQFNLIEVDSLEQLLNVARIIDFYGIKDVKNCVVFSISGGYGVVLVDLLEKAGMRVPDFTPEIQKELDKKFFIRGTSSKNPLDLAAQLAYSESIKEIIDLALSDPNIDALIMDFPSWYFSQDFFITPDAKYQTNIIEALCMGHKHDKYLLPIVQRAHSPEEATRISRILAEKKVPVFNDPLDFLPILPRISDFKRRIEHRRID